MRYPQLNAEQMSDRQREVAEAIKLRYEGELPALFAAMLYSPEMAERTQALGEFLRSGLRVPERLRVLAMLIAAGRHRSKDLVDFMTLGSVKNALLNPATIESLEKGERPSTMREDEAAVYDFCSALVAQGRVSSPLFSALVEKLGRASALELVAVCGYMAMLTNVMKVTKCALSAELV